LPSRAAFDINPQETPFSAELKELDWSSCENKRFYELLYEIGSKCVGGLKQSWKGKNPDTLFLVLIEYLQIFVQKCQFLLNNYTNKKLCFTRYAFLETTLQYTKNALSKKDI
jgi:hypothetical protein